MSTDRISFRALSSARDKKQTVSISRVTGPDGFNAIVYQCILNEDNDGAPTCYGPDGISPAPIEPLRYATNHTNWEFSPTNHNFEWHAVYNRTKQQADDEERDHKPPRWKIDFKPQLKDRNGAYPVIKQTGADKGYYVSTT